MRSGLGIRPELFNEVFEQRPSLGFIEAHSENYFAPSLSRAKLAELRQDYPLSLHGVGLSLGRADHLDKAHLNNLKLLVDEFEPVLVSEHLAWSAYAHRHLPDLLPLPLTPDALEIISQHIEEMQDTLQRQILLENPSNYLLFDALHIPEADFLNQLVKRTGCGVLLDVNNVYVSACNLGRDPKKFIAALDTAAVKEFHLAGHTPTKIEDQQVLIDTHNQPVSDAVWELFEYTLQKFGPRPTLIEWDSDFPELSHLTAECDRADAIIKSIPAVDHFPNQTGEERQKIQSNPSFDGDDLSAMQQSFLDKLISQQQNYPQAIKPHQQRLHVYQNNVFGALNEYLCEVYPATRGVVGDAFFRQMTERCVQHCPPENGDITLYGEEMASVINMTDFESLGELPYLADLIDYEWALHRAYFADLSDLLIPQEFGQEALLTLPVKLNSSVNVIDSAFPILDIHRQSLPDYDGEVHIDLGSTQDTLLVSKQDFLVNTRKLGSAEELLINNLQISDSLLQAIEALTGSLTAEELSAAMTTVISLQLLSLATTDPATKQQFN